MNFSYFKELFSPKRCHIRPTENKVSDILTIHNKKPQITKSCTSCSRCSEVSERSLTADTFLLDRTLSDLLIAENFQANIALHVINLNISKSIFYLILKYRNELELSQEFQASLRISGMIYLSNTRTVWVVLSTEFEGTALKGRVMAAALFEQVVTPAGLNRSASIILIVLPTLSIQYQVNVLLHFCHYCTTLKLCTVPTLISLSSWKYSFM